jgi:uncharacterized protein
LGGEPLLAKKVVFDISRHISDLVAQSRGLRYIGAMTTNGFLLDPNTVRELHEVGVRRYQITLDGYDEQHDKTRVLARGGGSFARIWANLGEIRKTDLDLEIMIRVHLHPANVHNVVELSEHLGSLVEGDSRFSVLVKAIEHLGGANDDKFNVMIGSHKEEMLNRIKEVFARRVPLADVEAPICYAAKANSLIVRANGDIAKCTVALRDERNRVGHITEDGRLIIQQEKIAQWTRGLMTRERSSLECPLRAMSKPNAETGNG